MFTAICQSYYSMVTNKDFDDDNIFVSGHQTLDSLVCGHSIGNNLSGVNYSSQIYYTDRAGGGIFYSGVVYPNGRYDMIKCSGEILHCHTRYSNLYFTYPIDYLPLPFLPPSLHSLPFLLIIL